MDSISEVTLKSSNLNSAVPLIVILNRLFKRSVLTNEDIQKLGIKLAFSQELVNIFNFSSIIFKKSETVNKIMKLKLQILL